MEQRSVWSEAFSQWKEEKASQWKRAPSWWNLLILLPPLLVLLWSVQTSRTDFAIAKRQMTTVATVSSHDPPNHDRYGYTILVNQKQYNGWAYPSDKIDYSLGERVVVHYDPTDPAHNLTASFDEAGVHDLFFVPFCLVIIAALPLFIFFRRRAFSRDR